MDIIGFQKKKKSFPDIDGNMHKMDADCEQKALCVLVYGNRVEYKYCNPL